MWVLIGVPAVLVALAVLVPVLVARPLLLVGVAAASLVVGVLAGVAVWRRRNRGRDLPSLSDMLASQRRTDVYVKQYDPRPGDVFVRRTEPPVARRVEAPREGSRRVPLLVLAALVVVAVGVFAIARHGDEPASPSRGATPPRMVPAKYDATLDFDPETGSWAVHETIDVPLRKRRETPATLEDDWAYDGPGSGPGRGVYVRTRTIAAQTSFWPFKRVINVIAIPQPVDGRRVFIAADRSIVRFVGPRRLVGDTTPAPSKRGRNAGGRETVELSLTGLRHNPSQRQVEVDVANGLGRSAIYAFVVKWGPWLLGLVLTTAVGFFVTRELNKRYGNGGEPAPAPA